MFKKFLLLILTVVGSNFVFAQAKDWGGIYGQLGIGYQTASFSASGGTYAGTPYSLGFSNTNGFASRVGFGYNNAITDKWLIGVGVDNFPSKGSNSTATATIGGKSASETLNVNTVTNYFVEAGYVLNAETMTYLKIGNSTTKYGGNLGADSTKGTDFGLGLRHSLLGSIFGYGEVNYIQGKSTSDGLTGTVKSPSTYVILGAGYVF
jgi:hypothetical protein